MNTTAIATELPQAELLASAMQEINAAQSFKEFAAANEKAIALGLRLRRGFYGSIHPERIALVQSATSEADLLEILQAINYDEIML